MKPMTPLKPMAPMKPMEPVKPWWPEWLGASPDSAGGQNNLRYAYFAEKHRLAIDRGGKVTLYDTADHRIHGVAQAQGTGSLGAVFTSQMGEVAVDELDVVQA